MKESGGKPVSHYVVEKKDKTSGKWTPVSKFCRTPECEVTGLEEGEQYEFRVSAVNEIGQSEPLVTDKPITAKHPFGKLLISDCHSLSLQEFVTLILQISLRTSLFDIF